MAIEYGLARGPLREILAYMRTGTVDQSRMKEGRCVTAENMLILAEAPSTLGATDKIREGLAMTADNCLYCTFTEPTTKSYNAQTGLVTRPDGVLWATFNPNGIMRWIYVFLLGFVFIDSAGALVVTTPSALSAGGTLAAWYRYGIGLTNAGGGACSAWADQSGNGRDLVQGTGTAQPTIQSDSSLLFDGTSDQMEATFTHNQPVTWYILMRQVAWSINTIICDGSAAQVQLFQATSSPGIRATSGSGNPISNGLSVGSYGVLVGRFSSTDTLIQVNNNSAAVAAAGSNNPGGFSIGANRAVVGFSNIQVKEIVLVSALHDDATRSRIISYEMALGGVS